MSKPKKPTVLVAVADRTSRNEIATLVKISGARALAAECVEAAKEVSERCGHVDLLIADPCFVDGSAIQLSYELEQNGHAGRAILLCMTRREFAGTKAQLAHNIRSLFEALNQTKRGA